MVAEPPWQGNMTAAPSLVFVEAIRELQAIHRKK